MASLRVLLLLLRFITMYSFVPTANIGYVRITDRQALTDMVERVGNLACVVVRTVAVSEALSVSKDTIGVFTIVIIAVSKSRLQTLRRTSNIETRVMARAQGQVLLHQSMVIFRKGVSMRPHRTLW